MDKQLEQALTKLIEKALNGIDAAGDFMTGEIPEVVSQLLLWHGVESFIWFTVFFASAVFLQAFVFMNRSAIAKEFSLGFEPILIVIWGTPLFLMLIALSKNDWLKILIAPKLYLLEYAAKIAS